MVAVGLGLCTVTLWTPYPARKPGERREPAARDAPRPGGQQEFEVTDEMIARLLADPGPAPGIVRSGRIRRCSSLSLTVSRRSPRLRSRC